MTIAAVPRARALPLDPGDNQRRASNPAASVWVNASAGSGKTTVLTSRVTRLLLANVAPEKILCLTYTRAGAAEMTNRITGVFSKWVSCDDDELRRDFDKLQNEPPTQHQLAKARRLFAEVLSCPGGLRIRTIHSFCQEILSRFPIEAGLPPHFSLIDEQDLDVLRNNTIDDLLREAAKSPDSELAKALAVLVAEQGEHGFTKMLQSALRECGRLTQDIKTLSARTRHLLLLKPDDNADKFRRAAMECIPVETLRHIVLRLTEGTKKFKPRASALQKILDLPPPQRLSHFEDYCDVFLKTDGTIRQGNDVLNTDLRGKYPDFEPAFTREGARLVSAREHIEAAQIAQTTESVLIFGAALAQRLATAKAARAALDYDDLILHTEKLLCREGINAWILYKLDNGIDHVLVDEAQDTSRAQWNIVQALTSEFYVGEGARADNERTLFVVGDEKQSIFSFQNADPEGFASFRDTFTNKLENAGQQLEKVPLHVSFRSAEAILKAVDAVFESGAARKGVSQDPVEHFACKNPDGSDKIGRVEVWSLIKPVKDNTKSDGTWLLPTGYEDEHDPQAEVAQNIALKIKGWLTRKEVLPGAATPIKPSDIMILLRRRGRFADLMVRALKSNKVPVSGIDRMHLLNQLPVMDLLSLLRFALLPEDDLNLAALLRSPLLGLSEDQLMQLAIGREGTLWQSLKESPAFTPTRSYLEDRLSEPDFSSPFEFLSRVLASPCPANPVSGRQALWARLGDETLDPIEELLNAAQNFSRSHSPSLQNFLHWLAQADAEIKRELDRGDECGDGQVRIMTVHASKGLEAPIVFLPDTASLPRALDVPPFQWGGEGAPLFLARKPSFGAALHVWQAARDKQLEEYRRLFYVALTRAANRLYICGWQTQNAGEGSWYNLAASALRPLHQEHVPHDGDNVPEIAFADTEISMPLERSQKMEAAAAPSLPLWALQSVPPEATPARSAPALPSVVDDVSVATPDAAFARGRIIHRLLQSLPDIAPQNHLAAISRFLKPSRHGLNDEQCNEITHEVEKLLGDAKFQSLFAANSRAEVALTGSIDGVTVFRQIDRLCLRGDEVWIVDFKTNRPPPSDEADIPAPYRKQLSEYRVLLDGIYPNHKVRCFLLWTYAPRLMEINF